MRPTVSARGLRFQLDPRAQGTPPAGISGAVLELASLVSKPRDGDRTGGEMAVERPAPERSNGIDQTPIVGREKGAGAIVSKRRPLAALPRDLPFEELPFVGGDGRLASRALEVAATGRRGTGPPRKLGVGLLENRERGPLALSVVASPLTAVPSCPKLTSPHPTTVLISDPPRRSRCARRSAMPVWLDLRSHTPSDRVRSDTRGCRDRTSLVLPRTAGPDRSDSHVA